MVSAENSQRGLHAIMKIHCTFIIVAELWYSCLAADIGSKICSVQYQKALTEALIIKKDCTTAAFYDCCQVWKDCDTWLFYDNYFPQTNLQPRLQTVEYHVIILHTDQVLLGSCSKLDI